ncbi:hypothetical protein QJS04_geneDACA023696 [Acorus gramineus]|uniref:Reverse transcriptase zinc-binding domain-containing protein n=1 Tax=Acorus gramineus TaxID=55184 RepID=A0AAV9BSI2_ACOGR|nr:hypothetical protein QJS04_geneDACA023696 [Acorus gramineus]
MRWKPAASGVFTVKSAYKWWRSERMDTRVAFPKFSQIWKLKISLKIKVFMWLLSFERLLTRTYRARWAPNDSILCPLCSAAPENVHHLFCACPVAMEFWGAVGIQTGLQHTFASIDDVWAAGKAMKRAAMNSLEATILQAINPAGAWTIWRTRNEVIFQGSRIYQENMQDMFKGCMRDWGVHVAKAEAVSFKDGVMRITG